MGLEVGVGEGGGDAGACPAEDPDGHEVGVVEEEPAEGHLHDLLLLLQPPLRPPWLAGGEEEERKRRRRTDDGSDAVPVSLHEEPLVNGTRLTRRGAWQGTKIISRRSPLDALLSKTSSRSLARPPGDARPFRNFAIILCWAMQVATSLVSRSCWQDVWSEVGCCYGQVSE